MTAFIDANVPILATGPAVPPKDPCLEILVAARRQRGSCVTSSEAAQQVVHVLLRRALTDRRGQALRLLVSAVRGDVEPLLIVDVVRASELAADIPALQARDLIHLAVMERLGITDIISTDTGFDLAPGIRRLDPLALDDWRAEVFAAT